MPADLVINSDREFRNQTRHCSAAPGDNMNNSGVRQRQSVLARGVPG